MNEWIETDEIEDNTVPLPEPEPKKPAKPAKPIKLTRNNNKGKSRVCPWRNRAEFELVYQKIFGPDATNETKEEACSKLRAWKMRRGRETSASILSTLAILEVQVKDTGAEVDHTLASVYSSAFTRFLNFVTTIEKKKGQKKTMYAVANKLGIETFIVDLRHLCSHAQSVPSLETFRRSANYCMNWLKSFYWDRMLDTIEDTDVANLKVYNHSRFIDNLVRLLDVYDVLTEAIHKGAEEKHDIETFITDSKRLEIIEEYLADVKHTNLNRILRRVVKDVIGASKSRIVKECTYYLTRELLYRPYFIKATIQRQEDKIPIVQLHHKLFLEMNRNGFIDEFIYRCCFICEDRFEPYERRKCAAIWLDKMLEGIELMNEIGPVDRDEYTTVDELEKAEVKAYRTLVKMCQDRGVNTNETIVLHNFIIRSIEIEFDDEFMERRFENTDFVSAFYAQRLLNFVKEEEKKEKYKKLVDFIMIFKEDADDGKKEGDSTLKQSKIFTAEDDLKPLLTPEQLEKINARHQFGVWEEAPEYDWKRIPLGYVFGENEDIDNQFKMK